MRPLIFLLILLFILPSTGSTQSLNYDHLARALQLWDDDSNVPYIHFRNTRSGGDWVLKHSGSRFHILDEVAAGNEILTIQNNGRVGINRTSPGAFLNIWGNSTPSTPHILINESQFGDWARISFKSGIYTNYWTLSGLISSTTTNSNFNIYHSQKGNVFTALGNGNVGIGHSAPEAKLHIALGSSTGTEIKIESTGNTNWEIGPGNCPNDGGFHIGCLTFKNNGSSIGALSDPLGWLEYSDESLKKNISPSTNLLEKALQVKIRKFHFNQQQDTDQKSIGVIAQELQTCLPELVAEIDGVKSVAYNRFGVIAIKAIQEQQEFIEQQSKNISYQTSLILKQQSQIDFLIQELGLIKANLDHPASRSHAEKIHISNKTKH